MSDKKEFLLKDCIGKGSFRATGFRYTPTGDIYICFIDQGILIPLAQDGVDQKFNSVSSIPERSQHFGKQKFAYRLLKYGAAKGVFQTLAELPGLGWDIGNKLWFIDYNGSPQVTLFPNKNVVYNGQTKKTEILWKNAAASYLYTLFLPRLVSFYQDKEGMAYYLTSLNMSIVDLRLAIKGIIKPISVAQEEKMVVQNPFGRTKEDKGKVNENQQQSHGKANQNQETGEDTVPYLSKLLDCDKRRCGLKSYEKERLYDIKAGHWDLFENPDAGSLPEEYISRDPRKDIKKNGVIGIDFGTKSTVVVKQEGSNDIRPLRIGSLSLSVNVQDRDFENPTIISCIDIDKFLQDYQKKEGRPETSCEDMFVSYNAYYDYKNSTTENFYAFFSDLKQWASREKGDVLLQDFQKQAYKLEEENSLEKKTLNPIEVYAYYIGMYINNMRNGIYLKYLMSFPVKYDKEAKDLIRTSFEKGLKKSLPASIVQDSELMRDFSVEYAISEPAAYAAAVLELEGFEPEDETEKYFYGIFDFGGGTTDFDFGIWRGASDDEYDRYNCDYVLECFGADSDVHLGGENLLEMLAYHVFRTNKEMAAEKKIACACPADEEVFMGGEHLVNSSQSAYRNLATLKEALRPLWEQQEGWEQAYHKAVSKQEGTAEEKEEEKEEEYLELQMYNFDGKAVPNCRFSLDTEELLDRIKKRIRKGVESFFNCIEKTVLANQCVQHTSEQIYIFLAGNSCRSRFVKEIFDEVKDQYNQEYEETGAGRSRNNKQDRFELIGPLESQEVGDTYLPNAKTSVAYGLLKSRPGGKILVKKNYETDSETETRFKYYLGTERRGKFICKFSPMLINENKESQTAYGIWHKFQGAGTGAARIYYTTDPLANTEDKKRQIRIDKIPFHEVHFDADAGKQLFIRAVSPSVLEYAVAESEDLISDNIKKLDIDAD